MIEGKRRTLSIILCATVSLLLIAVYNIERILSIVEDDTSPHFERYAYVIVTYHKAGHELSHTLRGYIQNHFQKRGISLRLNRSSPRAQYDFATKCSIISLEPGTITILEAPEFHCQRKQLDDLLMGNPDRTQSKWGVRIIHLVRNPFIMAVSNYHFHSQDPTPEPFVHWANPCLLTGNHTGPLGDLLTPILSQPVIINSELPSALPVPIMSHEDFDNIANDCRSLYRTKPGLTNATYYEHLRTLDPAEGLRLATTDKFNHIALMANDLIMFGRVAELERDRSRLFPWRHRTLDLITMPMEDWIDEPGDSMYKFLDFVFRDRMPHGKKKDISQRYGKAFRKKSLASSHISTAKSADAAQLIESLRRDEVFGGPLARIESLMDDVLRRESLEVHVV